MLTKRRFFTGLLAMPAVIVTPGLLMPVRRPLHVRTVQHWVMFTSLEAAEKALNAPKAHRHYSWGSADTPPAIIWTAGVWEGAATIKWGESSYDHF